MNYSSLLRVDEDLPRARDLLERALAVIEQTYPPSHERVLYVWGEMGDLYRALGDNRRAAEYLQRSISAIERAFGPEHRMLADPLTYRGRLLLSQDRPAEAQAAFERSLQVRQKSWDTDRTLDVAETLVDIARCRSRVGDPSTAEQLVRRALSIERAVLVQRHRALVPTLAFLADLLLARDEQTEAAPLVNEALEISRSKLHPRHSARLHAEAVQRRLRAEVVNTARRR